MRGCGEAESANARETQQTTDGQERDKEPGSNKAQARRQTGSQAQTRHRRRPTDRIDTKTDNQTDRTDQTEPSYRQTR